MRRQSSNEAHDPDPVPLPPLPLIQLVGSSDAGDFHSVGRHIFDLVRERCAVEPNHRILDIGSGSGRAAVHFARFLSPETSYEGLDVSLPLLEWCRREITPRYPNFRFTHADLSNTLYRRDAGSDAAGYTFPYPDSSFDTAFATSVFTHLVPASARRYASEIARVLRPGGLALLTFFITDVEYWHQRRAGQAPIPFRWASNEHAVTSLENPEAVVAYRKAAAFAILREAGLKVRDFSYGSWRMPGGWTYQDAFLVARRAPSRRGLARLAGNLRRLVGSAP
jgi:SAM-dependent methyltransferase